MAGKGSWELQITRRLIRIFSRELILPVRLNLTQGHRFARFADKVLGKKSMKMLYKLSTIVLVTLIWTGTVRTQASETGAGTISSLSVNTLARSGYLEILGRNFSGSGQVLIDGISAPVTRWESNRIVAYVPEIARLTAVPVQVVNASGQPSNTLNLTVTTRVCGWSREMAVSS